MLAITGRELRVLFASPSAWAMLAVVQAILGYLFLTQIDMFMQLRSQLMAMPDPPGLTEIVAPSLFGSAGIVLLMVVPLITMRSFAEERRNQTLPLLLSAPVSVSGIVVGKYLALVTFLTLVTGLTALMPASLRLGTPLDLGLLAAGVLGLWLLLASFAALGLFVSTLTAHPVTAAVSTFGVLLLLWILDWASTGGGEGSGELLRQISMLNRYQPLLKGVFSTADVAYFVLFIALFLGLSIRRLDAERLSG
ncbi:MAG: ABC transporter permease subunit [Immundisolibacter sp.]